MKHKNSGYLGLAVFETLLALWAIGAKEFFPFILCALAAGAFFALAVTE